MTKEDAMKLSKAFPYFSEERIRLLGMIKKLNCTKEEKKMLLSKTDEQLKAFITEKLKNKR